MIIPQEVKIARQSVVLDGRAQSLPQNEALFPQMESEFDQASRSNY